MQRKALPLLILTVLGIASVALAAPTGLWQFNGNMNAEIGSAITIKGGAPAEAKVTFGTCSGLGLPLIGGQDAQVMSFLPFTLVSEGIEVRGNLPANGGGSYCNRWTLAMDFCTHSDLAKAFDAWGYSTPFDTNSALTDDEGEIYFKNSSGNISLGAGGRLGGYYAVPNIIAEWHRIVITTDAAVGNVKIYFDGTFIGTFARGKLIESLPDGKYSLDTGSLVSLILFSAASGGDEGGGILNSLAIYDHVLSAEQIAELGGPTAAGLPSTAPTGTPALKRHSQFLAYVNGDNRPVNSGDATGNFAIDNTWADGTNGYYKFTSLYDGSLKLHHRANGDWDDPGINIETNGTLDVYESIAVDSPLEIQVEFVPEFGLSGRYEYFDLNMSEVTGLSNGQGTGDIQTRFYNLGYGTLGFEANNASGNGSFRIIAEKVGEVSNVRAILTYDPAATQYHVYYEVNNSGVILEAPGSPKTVTRTKTAFRIECEQDWVPSGYTGHNIYIKDVKVYNAIQTSGPSGCVDGYVLRHSDFASAAGSCAADAYWPTAVVRELDSMYMPSGIVDEYDGAGLYGVYHAGTAGLGANATVACTSAVAASAEWKTVIRTQFAAAGNGQMFNFKVDGNDVAFYLGNFNNTASLLFGESGNIFSPNPANVAVLPVAADQINSMVLIINYDASTQKYGAYYQINGLPMERHPSCGYAKVRTSSTVEFQWQVWNTVATSSFIVALDDYTETCGVQTYIPPVSAVADFPLFE